MFAALSVDVMLQPKQHFKNCVWQGKWHRPVEKRIIMLYFTVMSEKINLSSKHLLCPTIGQGYGDNENIVVASELPTVQYGNIGLLWFSLHKPSFLDGRALRWYKTWVSKTQTGLLTGCRAPACAGRIHDPFTLGAGEAWETQLTRLTKLDLLWGRDPQFCSEGGALACGTRGEGRTRWWGERAWSLGLTGGWSGFPLDTDSHRQCPEPHAEGPAWPGRRADSAGRQRRSADGALGERGGWQTCLLLTRRLKTAMALHTRNPLKF